MSLSFVCQCGHPYTVGDELAGKLARCKQCGHKMRIPRPESPALAPGLDIYGLDDKPTRAARAPAEPVDETSGPIPAKKTAKRPKSRASKAFRGFLQSLPRGDDLNYPIYGVVALVLTVILALFGGFMAKAFAAFVAMAAVACFLWACGTGLRAAFDQGFVSVLALLPALGATAVFFYTLLIPNPTLMGSLAAALATVACYAAFFFKEKRGEEYRQPIAIGLLASLLVVSFLIMLTKVRYIAAHPNNEFFTSADQADVPPPDPQAGQPIRPQQPNPGPIDAVSQAMARKASLTEARRGFQTKLVGQNTSKEPLETPPPRLFRTVHYDTPAGQLAAYLTPDPGHGRKYPAILWIHGGDSNSIGDVWSPRDPANDQSASAYREAGIVMMFPSLRGGNDNPGRKEAFLGEVDDVLAAADFLAAQDYVDPARIYLGGHSTGGTLVLLVAESTNRFRAVFSFGPASDVRGYGPEFTPFDTGDVREAIVRSPGYWLHSVGCPTFVFEGKQKGNALALETMERNSQNPLLRFYLLKGADHFNILDPTNRKIAAAILDDEGSSTNISFHIQDLNQAFAP